MKKTMGIYLSIFLVALLVSFFLVFSFLKIFYEFEIINIKTLSIVSISISIVFALIGEGISIFFLKRKKKTMLGRWLLVNSAKLVLGYILLIVFFLSVKSGVFFTVEDMKDLLSLEWCIIGISITIFLIWNVLTIEYLEKRKPQKPEKSLPVSMMDYLGKKEDFYFDATHHFNNLYLLLVNLFGLSAATGCIYVVSREVTIFSQTLVIFVLYLCTNTILGLLLDILKPFNDKKKKMLDETKITKTDITLQNLLDEEIEEISNSIKTIGKLDNVDQEYKKDLIMKIIQSFINKYDEQKTTLGSDD